MPEAILPPVYELAVLDHSGFVLKVRNRLLRISGLGPRDHFQQHQIAFPTHHNLILKDLLVDFRPPLKAKRHREQLRSRLRLFWYALKVHEIRPANREQLHSLLELDAAGELRMWNTKWHSCESFL